MDFEEELDLFFVKKDNTGFSAMNQYKKSFKQENYPKDVFNCVPLMVKQIKCVNRNWKDVSKLFADRLKFKNCLIYGKIIGKNSETKSGYSYILDDGTASINIHFFRRTDDMETIWKMDNELQAVARQMMTQNKNEIVKVLKDLMFKIKEQIDNTNIPMGAKALVYGKPTFFRGETSLNVYSFLKDEKYNRDIEIYFKDYLIDWYKKYIVSSSS